LTAGTRLSPLAPFRIRNFRFQWPADLATSWGFEMENLILGWYILVETNSVLVLTVFLSLQYIGTLVAPFFGVVGDRIGHRNMLCGMRAFYTIMATTMMTLALTGALVPAHVFVIATLMGIVRQSDQVMRYSVIGAIMPPDRLMAAIGVARTTMDSARIVGALVGAALVAKLGMGPAYAVIATLYATSLMLTWQVRPPAQAHRAAAVVSATGYPSPWREFKEGAQYVWTKGHLMAAMCMAFLVNLCAFPLVSSLMPYVAREVYRTDQTGLAYLVASFASGALTGSLTMARVSGRVPPARTMLVFCALWYGMIFLFSRMPTHTAACMALFVTGLVQSLGMVAMSTLILRSTDAAFRGRVMGFRMLAIYGVPIGLLISGPLITNFSYPITAAIYCAFGITLIAIIAFRWRKDVWRRDAPANVH